MIDYLMMNILKYLCLQKRFEIRLVSKQVFRLVDRLKDDFNEKEEKNNILLGYYHLNHRYSNAILCSQIEYIKFKLKIDKHGIMYYDAIEQSFKSKYFEKIINLFNIMQFITYINTITSSSHTQSKMTSEIKRILKAKCEFFNYTENYFYLFL